MPGPQSAASATGLPSTTAAWAWISGRGPTFAVTVVLDPAYREPSPSTTVPSYGCTVLAATVVAQGDG